MMKSVGYPGRKLSACLALVILLLAGGRIPAFGAIVVDGTTVTAARDGAKVTAEVKLINLGEVREMISDLAVSSGCAAVIDNKLLEPLETTAVTIDLSGDCFSVPAQSLTLDLDGPDGPLPMITVEPPTEAPSDWTPLLVGLLWGAGLGLLMTVTGLFLFWQAKKEYIETQEERDDEYEKVKTVVAARTPLDWKAKLEPQKHTLAAGTVANLESGWSLQDSLISNLTLATTAFVALVTSVDAATAILGDEPKAAFRVMAVAGLMSAVLIGIANMVLKILGPSIVKVSPLGLILSSALVVSAATLQTVTVGVAAEGMLVDSEQNLASIPLVTMVVVVVALLVYAARALKSWIVEGFPSGVPTIPDDALTSWKATEGWEAMIVEQRIRTAFAPWLNEAPLATIGYPTPIQRRTSSGDDPRRYSPYEQIGSTQALL